MKLDVYASCIYVYVLEELSQWHLFISVRIS